MRMQKAYSKVVVVVVVVVLYWMMMRQVWPALSGEDSKTKPFSWSIFDKD